MHKIKVHGPEDVGSPVGAHRGAPVQGVRETIFWILFCFILAAGAFGWGYICNDHRVDDLREQVHRLDGRQKDMNGRLIAVEGLAPRKAQGRP